MTARALPSRIYLDSSIIAAAIISGDPHSTACRQFCANLAAQNSAVYFSQILRLEVARVIRRIATTSAAPQPLQQHYQLSQFNSDAIVRQQWMEFGIGELDAFLRTFATIYELPYRALIGRQAIQLMSRFNLKSYDAAHVATALRAGVQDFATVDSDYARVTELTVHVIR